VPQSTAVARASQKTTCLEAEDQHAFELLVNPVVLRAPRCNMRPWAQRSVTYQMTDGYHDNLWDDNDDFVRAEIFTAVYEECHILGCGVVWLL
jgi:hypothetical protein